MLKRSSCTCHIQRAISYPVTAAKFWEALCLVIINIHLRTATTEVSRDCLNTKTFESDGKSRKSTIGTFGFHGQYWRERL